jgi:hypothetical protein
MGNRLRERLLGNINQRKGQQSFGDISDFSHHKSEPKNKRQFASKDVTSRVHRLSFQPLTSKRVKAYLSQAEVLTMPRDGPTRPEG